MGGRVAEAAPVSWADVCSYYGVAVGGGLLLGVAVAAVRAILRGRFTE